MADIIRQLRYIQEKYKNDIVSTGRVVISDLARDCANEIERLQSENTRLKAERDKAVEHIEQIMKYCDNRACKICKRRPKRNDIHCIECSPKYSGLEVSE